MTSYFSHFDSHHVDDDISSIFLRISFIPATRLFISCAGLRTGGHIVTKKVLIIIFKKIRFRAFDFPGFKKKIMYYTKFFYFFIFFLF